MPNDRVSDRHCEGTLAWNSTFDPRNASGTEARDGGSFSPVD
jgi:hypothetical protein